MFSASWSTVSPQRWLSVTFTPLFICYYAVLRSSLDIYGAFVALFMGAILTLANLAFLFDLLFFFLSRLEYKFHRYNIKQQFSILIQC